LTHPSNGVKYDWASSLNYTDLVNTITNLTVISSTDPNFIQIFPQAISYAEDRLYRELDLLSTVTRVTGTLTAGSRNFTLPQTSGYILVTNGFNVITPATQTNPEEGTRVPLTPTSRDYLDNVWPSSTGSTTPTEYAMITDQTIVLGPWPDANYTIEVIGVVQPAPLSATNPTTFLSLYLPDLLTAAVMIFMVGYQRDWGAQTDDPTQAQSWEAQYGKLFASANVFEVRKKYESGGWGSLQPTTPVTTPSR
jgi:hypothetical protein